MPKSTMGNSNTKAHMEYFHCIWAITYPTPKNVIPPANATPSNTFRDKVFWGKINPTIPQITPDTNTRNATRAYLSNEAGSC